MHRSNDLFSERLPLVPGRPWISYPAAVLLVIAGFFIRLGIGSSLPPGFPFVTFFPVVILASFLFGTGPGIVAALLSGYFSYTWFILPASHGEHSPHAIIAILFYGFVVGVDLLLVYWMQRANRKLAIERERSRQLAHTREMLFHELQHRISNNLQVCGALLGLQRRSVKDANAQKALDEAARRLVLIGQISRNLYNSETGMHRIGPFLETLAHDILKANGRQDIALEISLNCDPEVPADASVPMALVIAEAITNAIEHGLAGRADSHIAITVSLTQGGQIQVEIADNGVGLPQDFALEKSESLGLKIASMLARQLKGAFALSPRSSGGAVALLEVPL